MELEDKFWSKPAPKASVAKSSGQSHIESNKLFFRELKAKSERKMPNVFDPTTVLFSAIEHENHVMFNITTTLGYPNHSRGTPVSFGLSSNAFREVCWGAESTFYTFYQSLTQNVQKSLEIV